MRNITIEDVRVHSSFFFPYTIRCNVTNPCTDINFYNVRTDHWLVGQKSTGYICEYAMGKGRNNVPKIHCLDDDGEEDEDIVQGKESNLFDWAFEESLTAIKVSRMIFEEIEKAAEEIGY